MPLSSSSPPILPAKSDNEGADNPKKTSHKEKKGIGAAQRLSLHAEKLFPLVCFPAAFRCLFKLGPLIKWGRLTHVRLKMAVSALERSLM